MLFVSVQMKTHFLQMGRGGEGFESKWSLVFGDDLPAPLAETITPMSYECSPGINALDYPVPLLSFSPSLPRASRKRTRFPLCSSAIDGRPPRFLPWYRLPLVWFLFFLARDMIALVSVAGTLGEGM